MRSMADALLARAGDTNPGLRFDDLEWSWGEVVDDALRRAALWTELRQPGPPHVAVLLDNVPEHVWWLGACALSASVVVGANPTHRGEALAAELRPHPVPAVGHRPEISGPRRRLGPRPGHRGRLDGQPPRVVVVDSHPQPEGPAPAIPDVGDIGAEALGYLIFTSGTTGRPKACRCTQGRMLFIGAVLAERYGLGPDMCCYLSMPLFHSNALMAGWAPAVVGGSTMALPTDGRFSASGFLPDVRRHGVTYCNYVGRPLSYVLATPEQPDDADNPLRFVFGNEAAPGDVERFARRFGCDVSDNYGSTEGGVAVSRTPDTPDGALGPAPPDTRVVTEHGEECAVAVFDERGRLVNADVAIGELVATNGSPLLRGVLGERTG